MVSKRDIKKAVKKVVEARKIVKEINEMSTPAKQMMASAVVISVTNWFKELKTFDCTKKWSLKCSVLEGRTIPEEHFLQFGKRKIKGPGVVVFKEKSTGLMSISSTVDLALYLPEITIEAAKRGKFGAGPKAMEDFDVYYEECSSTHEARKRSDRLRTAIRREKLNK